MPAAIDMSADFVFAVFTVNLHGALNGPQEGTTVVRSTAPLRGSQRLGCEREEGERLLHVQADGGTWSGIADRDAPGRCASRNRRHGCSARTRRRCQGPRGPLHIQTTYLKTIDSPN